MVSFSIEALSLSLNGNADDDFRRKPPSEVTRINHFPSIAQMFETGESEAETAPLLAVVVKRALVCARTGASSTMGSP